jgi:hypothetical protein
MVGRSSLYAPPFLLPEVDLAELERIFENCLVWLPF